ncbi:TP53-binding protein 1 [Trichonephila inaurata madagascariensis]|uniref:TP53-binding protein 1 n=1 Tax=Trichonephila inaurata madagascariensis TaxID=2747483 RepID=A0A8X7CBT3_9ARAC|nr:TP53-binding protein 1 [Trichonephila inaurata madagascariensis]
MDKENDKKSLHPGSSDSTDQGNSQGFSPRAGAEPEPVRVLELSESFFAADTVDDDESIIPPTQEMLIPNTPPPEEASDKEGNVSNGNNDTSLSNLDETCIGDIEKDIKQMEAEKDELMEIGSQNDMTQDIPGLEETQPILGIETVQYLSREVMEDDEWQLRFSESQETQELLDPSKMRDIKEPEHLSAIAEEKEEESVKKGASPEKQTDTQKIESGKSHDNSDDKFEDDDSENEIEPSQSCLDDNTYSAFRDQLTQIAQENQKAYSTPDPECILKGQKTGSQEAKALMPSPIGKKVEAHQSSRLTEQTESELEQTTDILASESQQPSSPLQTGILEANEPIFVLDTEPQQLKDSPIAETPKDETMVVCDTIELASSTDDTGVECLNQEDAPELVSKMQENIEKGTKKESEDSGTNGKELGIDEIVIVTAKEEIKVPEAKGSSTEEYDGGISSGENCLEDKKEVITLPDSLPDTLPATTFQHPFPPLSISRLSRRQKFETIKKNSQQGSNYEKSEKTPRSNIGTFKDTKSLENIFNGAFGIFLDHECLEAMLSLKPNEELKVKKVLDFSVKNNTVFLEQSIEIGSPNYHQRHAISPHSGSSSATTNSTATTKSLHSGEMADISSSSSAKSANSSGMHFDSTVHSTLSSQEHAVKTSTQNSEQPSSFGNIFTPKKKDDSFEMEKTDAALPNISISPIKKKETQTAAAGRKRGGRKAAQINNKAAPVAKRKRGRNAKVTDDVVEEISTADDVESKPKKLRKKRNEKEPPPEPPSRDSPVVQEIVASDSSDDPYKDSPFGRMLPGVRVMARWKDGYYYPGIVQKQESEGRWSVKFDDEDIKAIPQENLIKVYNLEKGTSVLAMSPDDFYDPGIICGHYTDSTGSGYEVELDNGVTKRYPRSAVILSNDQAKLLTSSRPPTTPATMTINLDNIVDGKRKRKSVQTSEPSPVLKKSPRRISSRISKIDPNLDSTEESAHTDKEPLSIKRQMETTETEGEDTLPQRSTRKRKAAKTGAIKITHAITQSSGRHPKLLKDYAFLLTNAERKPAPKVNTSDSETLNEEEEIMPFNKDELVAYILSRGGTILDKFDDVQDCKKRNIFLLANTYLRTMKYIKCIAAGIICIKHHWVQNCCFKGEILNHVSYILPAGKSLITNEIVEWHGRSDVLKGLKISLISGPDNPFVPTWTPVLLAAQADFVLKWNLPSSKSGGCFMHVDVLVTNSHCPPDVLQSARRRKIPIVSSEWIIQSLIAGKCLPYDAHPKFKHDYVE